MAKRHNVESLELRAKLLNDERRDRLSAKIQNYLKGMQEYVDGRVIVNDSPHKEVQIFFDSDINQTAKNDIWDIIIEFIS